MKSSLPRVAFSLMLIALGLLWLFSNLLPDFHLRWELLWPIFILFPGLLFYAFWAAQSNRPRKCGLLIPATILTGVAIALFIDMYFTTVYKYPLIWLWTLFLYPLSVSLAFFASYKSTGSQMLVHIARIVLFGAVWVFIGTIILVALITLLTGDAATLVWPILLIVLGFFVVLEPLLRRMIFGREKYWGKSEEEWKEWGQKFGKDIEQSFKPEDKKDGQNQ